MIPGDASPLSIALCHAVALSAIGEGLALNFEGGASQWVQLVPAGAKIGGNDGRQFLNPAPAAVVDAFVAGGLSLPIDINHALFLKAPKGDDAPAAGWIEELQLREGAIWGRVEWTSSGRAALNDRAYRYISPALITDRGGAIIALAGAGLVNRPNFRMPALNSQDGKPMWKELLKKLGLAETASESDAIAALDRLQTQLNAAQSASPSLALYVPRADYDAVLAQRNDASAALNARIEGERSAKTTALVEQAVKDGKIAPATKDFYVKLCLREEGLAEFEKFLAAQPSVFTPSGLDKKDPASQGVTQAALNGEQKAAALALGLDEKAFAEFIGRDKAA